MVTLAMRNSFSFFITGPRESCCARARKPQRGVRIDFSETRLSSFRCNRGLVPAAGPVSLEAPVPRRCLSPAFSGHLGILQDKVSAQKYTKKVKSAGCAHPRPPWAAWNCAGLGGKGPAAAPLLSGAPPGRSRCTHELWCMWKLQVLEM